MNTAVSKRGQTVIPAIIRERYDIRTGSRLQWIDIGGEIKLIPIPKDPIVALRGSTPGIPLRKRLLEERRKDSSLGGKPHASSGR